MTPARRTTPVFIASASAPVPKPRWLQRFSAWTLDRGNPRYEAVVAPYKRRLLSPLQGTVLEIGPGAGASIPYFDPRTVRWVGVEPNPAMIPYLERRARLHGLDASVHHGVAEALPVPDGSVNAVVSSLVLCSVDDVGRTLAEVRRVLAAGGTFVFLEHVAAPEGTLERHFQRAVTRITRHLADGCHQDRETGRALADAGFASLDLSSFRIDLGLAGPHIAGVARVA